MLVQLITPLLLASSPVAVTLPDALVYDHARQQAVVRDGEVTQTAQLRTRTSAGTRTFDRVGNPRDNDDD